MLASFSGFSQQLTYATGGNVVDPNSQKIKPAAVREIIRHNESALASYNAGREKKTWGNVLFYGGLGLGAINLYQGLTASGPTMDQNGYFHDDKTSPTLAIVGGALVLASIPVKAGYTKKIRYAIEEHNKAGGPTSSLQEFRLTLMANHNGMGVTFGF